MVPIITCVVILITAFSTTKKLMKNRKKTEPNRGNTIIQHHISLASDSIGKLDAISFNKSGGGSIVIQIEQ